MNKRTNTKRIATTVLSAALVAAVAVPAFAAPLNRVGRLRVAAASRIATAPAVAAGQLGAQLQTRIANALRARKARFDAANANLTRRITRVTALADKVEAAGGDVTAARSALASASASLAKANELEAAAIAKFRDIPNASDKRAAFVAARTSGRLAVAELKAARVNLRDAAAELRTVLEQLRSATSSTTVDAQ